jgi:hypothetical protein
MENLLMKKRTSNQKIHLVLIMMVLGISQLFPEGTRVEGTVNTAEGTQLQGVFVTVRNTDLKSITDENGYFHVFIKKRGVYVLEVKLEGFETEMRTIFAEEGRTLIVNFILRSKVLKYEITVTQEPPQLMSASKDIGEVSIKPEQVATLPSLGELDIFRSMQLIPGISASNESSSGLYVRGGKPDENLILYDGIPIYHVDHFFGIFSAFNANAIEEVKLIKGGFGAKYGGRISSVMELEGKSGGKDGFKLGAGINFLSFNALGEIPIGDKGLLFLSGRKSFQSPLYDKIFDKYNDTSTRQVGTPNHFGGMSGGRFGAMFDTEPKSYFYDLNVKATYKPSCRDILTLSFYNGMDNLDNSREIEIPSFMAERAAERGFEIDVEGDYIDLTEWGNTGLALNWLRQWTNSFSSNVTISYSRYFNREETDSSMRINRSFEQEEEETEGPPLSDISRVSDEENVVNDLSVKMGNRLKLGEHHFLEFGVQVTANEVDYDFSATNFRRRGEEENEDSSDPTSPINILNRSDRGKQYAFYLQHKLDIFKRLTVTKGFRVTYYDMAKEYYFEPRLSLILSLSEKIKLKAAWGKYSQFANNIVREDILQGDRNFWMLSDGELVPVSNATHWIAGISYESKNYLFDIEAYYKDLQGLSEFAYRFSPGQSNINYGDFFYTGSGFAKGIEFLLQRKYGNFTGWICYTLGEVEYDIPEFGDEPFPASHDVTHELKLVNSFKYKKWTLSATWIYATGRPYTEPISANQEVITPEGFDREIVINTIEYGAKNSARLPAYHRLDLALSLDLKIGNFKASTGISVFNVYNHKNIWRKEFDIVEDELIVTDMTYLGITPSLFINITF